MSQIRMIMMILLKQIFLIGLINKKFKTNLSKIQISHKINYININTKIIIKHQINILIIIKKTNNIYR